MIDPKDYPFHVQELVGKEQFNEYIMLWKQSAPWSDDEYIKNTRWRREG